MLVELVRSSCYDGKTCPALHRTGRDTVIVQGWAVTDTELLAQLDLPAGVQAVEVPADLLAEVLGSWPVSYRTARGTMIVPGTAVTEPEVLAQLRLPADEQAVEVAASLLAGVLQAC